MSENKDLHTQGLFVTDPNIYYHPSSRDSVLSHYQSMSVFLIQDSRMTCLDRYDHSSFVLITCETSDKSCLVLSFVLAPLKEQVTKVWSEEATRAPIMFLSIRPHNVLPCLVNSGLMPSMSPLQS